MRTVDAELAKQNLKSLLQITLGDFNKLRPDQQMFYANKLQAADKGVANMKRLWEVPSNQKMPISPAISPRNHDPLYRIPPTMMSAGGLGGAALLAGLESPNELLPEDDYAF